MSLDCSIVWQGDVPGLWPVESGESLQRSGLLDRDPGNGLRRLSEFFSSSPEELLEFLEYFPEDQRPKLPAGGFPPEQFFPAEEGLATVRAHLAFLEANPTAMRNAPAVIEDLRDFERVLARLAAAGVPFHLTIIP
jgi:hypothetical protein